MAKKTSIVDDLLDPVKGFVGGAIKSVAAIPQVVAQTQEGVEGLINSVAGRQVVDGNASIARGIVDRVSGAGQAVSDTRTERSKIAAAESLGEGSIFRLESPLSDKASVRGVINAAAEGLGSAIPSVATGLATRGRSARVQAGVGAATGTVLGAGAAGQQEGERVRGMDDAALAALPGYREAIAGGATPDAAREEIARRAENYAALAVAPVSALGGAATGRILAGAVPGAVAKAAGTSTAGRTIATGLTSAAEEGVQEVGEGVAQIAGANAATGETRDVGAGSSANALLGAAAGGPMGIAGGLLGPAPVAVIQPDRGIVSRAAAKGVETGAVQGARVERFDMKPAMGQPPGIPLPPDMISAAPSQITRQVGDMGIRPSPIERMIDAPRPLRPEMIDRQRETLQPDFTIDLPPPVDGDIKLKNYRASMADKPVPKLEPDRPDLYFDMSRADMLVPSHLLKVEKINDNTSIENAIKLMRAASEGATTRRDPVTVRVDDDGNYHVIDGNSTSVAAIRAGVKDIPVIIAEAPAGKEGWRNSRGYLPPETDAQLTKMYESAQQDKRVFDSGLTQIAKAIGGEAELVALKGRTRAEQKTLRDNNGDVRKLRDLLRATIAVDTLSQAQAAIEQVGTGFEVVTIKSALDPSKPSPYPGGYRDAKVIVRNPAGTVAEVQINLKPMIAAKIVGHKLYEEFRDLDAKIMAQGGTPTAEQQAQLDANDLQQRAIYEPAWAAATSSVNAASSISSPSEASVTRENPLGGATSNALQAVTTVSPTDVGSSTTGMPTTSKNLVPAGNAIGNTSQNSVPAKLSVNNITGRIERLGVVGRSARLSPSYGIIVAPKPGTKVEVDGEMQPYDRSKDAANLPPVAAPVQRPTSLPDLQVSAQAILKRPAAAKAMRQLFGVTGVKIKTIRGSYEGVPELSFTLEADGLTAESASRLAQFLGMAFAQDAVIVTKPDPVGPADDSIPTIELYNTRNTSLTTEQFDKVAKELNDAGIDYSEARGGKAIRVLHFGDEAGLEALGMAMAQIAAANGLSVNHLHTRSDMHEAQDYRRNLGEGGDQSVQGFGPEVFGALVDHFLVPYTKAVGGVGYRFNAERFAKRYGLDSAQLKQLKEAMAPTGTRSSVPVLKGEEPLPAKGKKRLTNTDAAFFLQNRAAALGTIDASDHSPAAAAVISDTFADEIEYQLSKPEGKSAVGWYDRQLKNAIDTIATLYPEVKSDPDANFIFKGILAVTSQGLTVQDNFNTAIVAYQRYKDTGKIQSTGFTIPGKSSNKVRDNIEKLAKLVNSKGATAAREFMQSMHTVRELQAMGYTPEGTKNDRVRGWMALGPKIGSFANNLDGDFDTLTADLWFSRTWNRVLGTMFRYSATNEARLLGEFRPLLAEAMKTPGNRVLDALTEQERADIGTIDGDLAIAKLLTLRYARDGYKDRSKLNVTAKNLTENVDMLQDSPRGVPERKFQSRVMELVKAKLKDRTGKDIQIADLQALLWYQEKDLFRKLGAANARSAPADYEDAARKAVESARITSLKMFSEPSAEAMEAYDLYEMDDNERAVVESAVKSLVDRGFPKAWLDKVSAVVLHSPLQGEQSGAYYIDGPSAGLLSIRHDMFQFEKLKPGSIADLIAHEAAHAADFNAETEGMYSADSPLFAMGRDANGNATFDGEIIGELHKAYLGNNWLSYVLSYPFAYDGYPDKIVKVEAFAQASMLYFTQPEALKKFAPKTYKLFKEMTNAASVEQSGKRASEGRDAAIREALQSAGRTSIHSGLVSQRAGRKGGRVDQGEQDRRDAGRDATDQRGRDVTPADAMLSEFDSITKANPFYDREHVFMHENGGAFGAAELSAIGSVDPKAVHISAIRSFDPGGRNGYGSYVLEKITQLADKHGVSLELKAAPFGTKSLNKTKLTAWYKRHGFEPAPYGKMIRQPKERITQLNSMPPPSVGFNGGTQPGPELLNHLRTKASGRMSGYRDAGRVGLDKFRVMFQDYFLPVRRAQEAIVAKGGTIDEDNDVVGREEVYYGRTGEQLKQLEQDHVIPLVDAMAKAGVSQEDLELYAYAKFAPARNARIASINPQMQDGGSGMSNADAAQIVADFAPRAAVLEPLRKRMLAMNELRVKTLEDAGLLSEGEAELWRAEPDYVPLKGLAEGMDEDPGAGHQRTGQGFSIGGKEAHMALGRQSRASDIIANIIAQTEASIIRAEKNRVATALLRLAQANENPALWTIDRVPEKAQLNKSSGEVTYKKDNLHRLKDNVVMVKVDGEQHFITLHDRQLAESMKNLGAAKMGAILRAFGSLNRFFSLTRTMLAPEFVLANFARDLQTASVNLAGEESAGLAARVMKDVGVSVKTMYAHNRNKNPGGEWGRWVQEFASEGGMTNFVNQMSVEEQQAKIDGLLAEARGGTKGATRKLARQVFDFIGDVNGAVENGVRLSAYANARRSGMSKHQAARLAKNLTVNFNKKGSAGPALNALYLFFNASIQGSTRFLRAMKNPRVQGIMASTAVLGFALAMANRANAGDDDDGENRYDKIPDWEKARNLIWFVPGGDGRYVKVPMPYTYNLPFLAGAQLEALTGGKAKPIDAAAAMINSMLTSFNPLGEIDIRADGAVTAEKLLAPTALDPLIDIVNNRNFFGAPITPEASPFDKVKDPDSQRYFNSTNPGAVWLANKLNEATGGDALRSGLIDISPGSMVYLFDYMTGGTGGFVERAATAIALTAKGEEVPTHKIPFYRVFSGELSDQRFSQTYYAARDDVNLRIESFKLGKVVGFASDEERDDAAQGKRLEGLLRNTERQLRAIRDRRKEAQAREDEEAVKNLERRQQVLQVRFARRYFDVVGAKE